MDRGSIVLEMKAADRLFGTHPVGGVVLVAETRFEISTDLDGVRMEPPRLAVVGPEPHVPIEGNDAAGRTEPGLLEELPEEGGLKIRVGWVDLAADGNPDPPSGGRPPEEQELDRRRSEQVPLDALPGDDARVRHR